LTQRRRRTVLVNRFVIRRDGVNERRGIPPVLRNPLRRLFIHAVERTALREADVFLAAADPNRQPPPPNNKVSFITTPRLNQFAAYVPLNAPPAQIIAANDYIARWISILESRGYSPMANDPRWRIHIEESIEVSYVLVFGWAGTGRIFFYDV
jgi:hypothetical protein